MLVGPSYKRDLFNKFVVALWVLVPALQSLAQPATSVRLTEDFKTDPGRRLAAVSGRASYSRQGYMELEPKSNLGIRSKVTGPVVRVRITAEFVPVAASAPETFGGSINYLRLDRSRPLTGMSAALVYAKGKGTHVGVRRYGSTKPIGELVKLQSKSLLWKWVFEFRFGLVRVKVWPDNQPEPKEWTLTRYDEGLTGLRQGAFIFSAGKFSRLRLKSLQLAGSIPITPVRSRKLLLLEREADLFRDRNDFTSAARKYRELASARIASKEQTDLIGFLRCQDKLASVLARARRYDDARQVRSATVELGKVLGDAHPIHAEMHHRLGILLGELEEFAQAYEAFDRAQKIQLKSVGIKDIRFWITSNRWARLLLKMGRGTEAKALLEKYIQAAERLPDLKTHLGAVYRNLGLVLLDQQDLQRAESFMQRSVRFWQDNKDGRSSDFERIQSRLALGEVQIELNRFAAARSSFKTALAELADLGLTDPLLQGSLESSLGFVLVRMAQQKRGLQFQRSGLARLQAIFPRGHKTIAKTLTRLASTCIARNELKVADGHLLKAKEILAKRYGPELGQVSLLRGRLLKMQGKHEPALLETLAAHNHLVKFHVRSLVTSPTRDHQRIKSSWSPVVSQALALVEGRPDLMDGNAADVLRMVYDWKAAGLRSDRERQITSLLRRNDKQAIDRQLKLRDKLRQLVQLQLKLTLAGRDSPAERQQQETVSGEVYELESDLALLLADQRLIQAGAGFPERLSAVPLPTHSALIEFLAFTVHHNEQTSRRLAAIITVQGDTSTDSKVRFVPLGSAERIEKLIHKWRRTMQLGQAELELAAEQNLRKVLWSPIVAHCRSSRHLIIAPDGEIALVPFAAFRTSDGGYEIEKHLISYATTGRDLVEAGNAATGVSSRNQMLIVSSPTFGSAPESDSAGSERRKEEARLHWQPLPHGVKESAAIRSLVEKLRPAWKTLSIENDRATLARVMKMQTPAVLHFISHAFYLPVEQHPSRQSEWPLPVSSGVRCGIALADANQWRLDLAQGRLPGLLVAAQAQQLPLLGTDLVVLSACGTGLGEVQIGEGVIGLRNSFLQAGARTVVASLWDVDDRLTKSIMTDFYRHWLQGYSKVESLRQAQLIALAKHQQQAGEKLRPYFWAGWTLHGDRGQTRSDLPDLTRPKIELPPTTEKRQQPELPDRPDRPDRNWIPLMFGAVAITTLVILGIARLRSKRSVG